MSAKKSWDVQPVRRVVRTPAPEQSRVQAPRRPAAPAPSTPRPSRTPAPASSNSVRAPLRPQPLPKGSLKQRRKQKRRYAGYVALFVLLILIAGFFYALWRPALRVQSVSVHGPDSETVQQIARSKLSGTYFYLIPRNSIFFLPTSKVRAAVLDASPDVAAVSFARTSFSSLEVTTTSRATAFVWCGTSIDTPYPNGGCFDADIEGFLFKASDPVSVGTASTTGTQTRVFDTLDRDIVEGQPPLRAHISYASALPDALRFVKAIRDLNVPVSALALRGDEADLWVGGPTRITYVLGHEEDAIQLAASSLANLTLTNGTIQYVDLRFPGKVYIKKYGE
ncbi:MAG: hypothetical protein V4480_00070 [Patescibacteria group bacterium]